MENIVFTQPIRKRTIFLCTFAVCIALSLLASGAMALSHPAHRTVVLANEQVEWRNFSPESWANYPWVDCSVEVSSEMELSPTTARYQYSLDGGLYWEDWTSAVAERLGPNLWRLQANGVHFAPGQSNRIRFAITNTASTPLQSPDYAVSVDYESPAVEVTWPSPGALISGTELGIHGTADDAVSGLDKMELRIGDDVFVLVPSPPRWSFTWTLPAADGTAFTITAVATDLATNAMSVTVPITVDTVPPANPSAITETHGITSGTIIAERTSLEFHWSDSSDGTGITGYKVYWGTNPSGTSNDLVTATSYAAPTMTSMSRYHLRISAVDLTNNRAAWETLFTVRWPPVPVEIALPMLERTPNPGYYEPNNTLATAYGPLEFDYVYKAYIWPEGDQDYYTVMVDSAAITLGISLTNIPADADYDLYLYDAVTATQPIAWSNRYGNADEMIAYPVSRPGRYFIRIYPYSGYSADQPYHLVVGQDSFSCSKGYRCR